MSRSFTTTDLSLGTAALAPAFNGAQNLCFSCWAKLTSVVSTAGICEIKIASNTGLGLRWSGTGTLLVCGRSASGDAFQQIDIGVSPPLNQWAHIFTRWDFQNKQFFGRISGVGQAWGNATLANTYFQDGATQSATDKLGSGSGGANLVGLLAEAAFWRGNLADAEVDALAAGVPPFRAQPSGLIFYMPLNEGGDAASVASVDWARGLTATQSGAPFAEHPDVTDVDLPVFMQLAPAAGAAAANPMLLLI